MDSTSVLVKTHVACETFNMYFVDKLMYHVARFMYVTHFIIRFVRNQDWFSGFYIGLEPMLNRLTTFNIMLINISSKIDLVYILKSM